MKTEDVISSNQASYPVLETRDVELKVEKVENLAKRIFSTIASGFYTCKQFIFSLVISIKSKISCLFLRIILGKSESSTESSNQEDEQLVRTESVLANSISNRASTALVSAVIGQCLMPQRFFLRQLLLVGVMIVEEVYPDLISNIKKSIGCNISHLIDSLKTNFLEKLPIAGSFLEVSFHINPFEVDVQNVAKKMIKSIAIAFFLYAGFSNKFVEVDLSEVNLKTGQVVVGKLLELKDTVHEKSIPMKLIKRIEANLEKDDGKKEIVFDALSDLFKSRLFTKLTPESLEGGLVNIGSSVGFVKTCQVAKVILILAALNMI